MDMSNYISLGFSVRKCVEVANQTMGSVLFLDVSMCIFVTIITMYFSPLIIQAFPHRDPNLTFNYVKFSFGLHCFLLFIKAGIRWVNFYRAGQKLANGCQKIKLHLENLLMKNKDFYVELEILIKRFDDESPLKPLNCFNLNLNTAISAAGLVATYLVILVQFKQSSF